MVTASKVSNASLRILRSLRLRSLRAVGLVVCCGLIVDTAWAEVWRYTVRPGDDLWTIAVKYCGSPSYANKISQHNNLASAEKLRAGQRIEIPVDWLFREPATAKVLSRIGEARYATGGDVQAGDIVEMGVTIVTADGFVVVEFADGSQLQITPETQILFNVLTAYADTGMVDTALRLVGGRTAARIVKRNSRSNFRIATPSGIAAVRGTDFRVAVESDKALNETVTGEVRFSADSGAVDVPAGFGVVASPSGTSKETLLEAPLMDATNPLVSPGDRVTWQTLSGAQSYRSTLYVAGSGGAPLLAQATSQAHFELPNDVTPGSYELRVRGVAVSGLEGMEASQAFELGTLAPKISTASDPSTQLIWEDRTTSPPYTVEFIEAGGRKTELQASAQNLQPHALAVLEPGQYQWRVKNASSPFSKPGSFTYRPLPVMGLSINAGVDRMQVSWEGDAPQYRLQVARDANFENLEFDETLADSTRTVEGLRAGRHYVRVAALANQIDSEYAIREVQIHRPPNWWWLSAFLPLLAL